RLDRVAFLDRRGVAEDDGADRLLLEVQGEAEDVTGELQELRGERGIQTVDLGDPVPDLDDRSDAARLGRRVERVDRRLDDAGDLGGTDCHWFGSPKSVAGCRGVGGWQEGRLRCSTRCRKQAGSAAARGGPG